MATTGKGFIKITSSGAPALLAVPAGVADSTASNLGGTRVDKLLVDLGQSAGYAKNGAVRLTLSGTTTKTVDLTNTTTTAQSYDGDTAFASFSQLIFYNDGASAVTVAVGASNGASLPLSGTITIAPGAKHVLTFASPVTVDSTHKNIDVTPTSGGSFVLLVGGA